MIALGHKISSPLGAALTVPINGGHEHSKNARQLRFFGSLQARALTCQQ